MSVFLDAVLYEVEARQKMLAEVAAHLQALEDYEYQGKGSRRRMKQTHFSDFIDERLKPRVGRREMVWNTSPKRQKEIKPMADYISPSKATEMFVTQAGMKPAPDPYLTPQEISAWQSRVHSQTLGDPVKPMYTDRSEREIKFFGPSDFYQLVHNSGIVLNVAGLEIPIENLAKADWSCRTKVCFYGPDHRRSVLCYRIDLPRAEQFAIPVIDLLHRLSDGTFNITPKVIKKRVVTDVEYVTVKEVITEEASNLELLERVERNIRAQIPPKTKKKSPPPAEHKAKIFTMEAAG